MHVLFCFIALYFFRVGNDGCVENHVRVSKNGSYTSMAVLSVLHWPRDMVRLFRTRTSVGDGDEGCVITKPCVYAAPVYFWQIVKHRLLRGPKENIIFIFTTRPGIQQFMVADDFGISLSPGTDHH